MDGYVLESVITGMVPIGVVPEGLRMDIQVEGRVTEGPLTGGRLSGTDFFTIRPDGVGVIDVRQVIRLDSGTTVSLVCHGYAHPPYRLPPLEEIRPDMEWPNADVPLHGAVFLRTGDPSLAELNRTVYGMTGTANMARGQLHTRAESLARVPVA